MKALKEELLQRLQAAKDERNRLMHRLEAVEELEKAIDLIIREEDLRTRETQLTLIQVKNVNGRKVIGRTKLSQFIVKALADGKPKPIAELAELAKVEGIDFQNKAPKRVLHFALIGLSHNNYARMVEKSVWQLTEKAIAIQSTKEPSQELAVNREAPAVAGR
ncbi:MAG: hypothetical protein ABIH70_00880 [Chloroflexota bacterium]